MKFLVVFALLAVGTQAKTLQLVNGKPDNIVVTVDNQDVSVLANGAVVLELQDGFSGSISAVLENAEVTTGPRTKVELTTGTFSDSYSVDVAGGFNVGLKVIPVSSSNCPASVCAANIINLCPLASQVVNSNGTVVACQSSPVIMGRVCPLAVVDAVTALINVKTCTDATGYLVIIS